MMRLKYLKSASRRHTEIAEMAWECTRSAFLKQYRTLLPPLLLCFLVSMQQTGIRAAGSQSTAPDATLQDGLNALKGGHFEEALRHLTLAERENPEDARIRNFRGITLMQLAKISQAEAEYREAIHLDPRLEDAWRNLGFLLWANNRLAEAREKLLQAIALAPEDSFAHYYLGRLNLEAQEYANAFRELEISGVPWPDDLRFLIQAAQGYVALGQSDEARKVLRQVLARQLSATEAAQVASLQIALQDYDPAIELLKHISKTESQNGSAWVQFDLALSYLFSGNYEGAVQQSRNYLERERNEAGSVSEEAAGWSLLGITQARANYPDEAVKALQEAAHLEPANEEHWLNLTREFMELSRYSEAIAATQEGITANPKSYALYLRLGAAQLAAGHYKEAEGTFRALVNARDPMATSYVGLAQVLLREGRADEAAAVVSAAEQHIGQNFLLSYFRGLSLERAGKHKEAANAFHEAIRMNTNSSEAHLGLGKSELAAGQAEEAIVELEQALRLNPANVQARRLLSQAYRRAGDTKRADQFGDTSSEDPARPEGDLLQDFLVPRWLIPGNRPTGDD